MLRRHDFQPVPEQKVWGTACHCFVDERAALSQITFLAGHRCSRHVHRERANLFQITSGALVVETWRSELKPSGPKRMALLLPGNTLAVPSGVWHRFRVVEDGEGNELYWPDRGGAVSADDIYRWDQGGPDDLAELRRELEEHGVAA